MTAAKDQPTPCTRKNCDGQHQPAERVALAASLCDTRGAKLTSTRRAVLELLWQNERPMGAYELIDALRAATSRSVAPPTVYRALEFLMAEGFVSKIESHNAYTPCAHPERRHDCMFFHCTDCGRTVEIEDEHIESRLSKDAAGLGFRVTRRTVEVEGVCGQCASAEN